MSNETVNGIADSVDDLVREPLSVSPVAEAVLAATLAEQTPSVEPEPVLDIPVPAVPRDYSMGPATGASIREFLEKKQAEADAIERAKV